MYRGFHHIGLYVKDLERSLEFYTKGLGGKVTLQFPMGDSGLSMYLIELCDKTVVELIPKGTTDAEANKRWAHICLDVDNVADAYHLAIKTGAVSDQEPRDGNMGTLPMTNAFVFGPDGESIEFLHERV